MAFTQGNSFVNKVTAGAAVFGAAAQAVNTVSAIGSALSNLSSADGVGSSIRALNLPAAGEAIGDIVSAVSAFQGDPYANDWRVRLGLPNWSSFRSSPVLKPLRDAGGLVFPFTPKITIKASAKYSAEPLIHTNYPVNAYKSSDPGNITINATMAVEDAQQALYWIAAVHYLRSVSKMFTGFDPKAGNPPPIVYLNGYGNYVFKNVPVVVTQFDCTLPDNVDYIHTEVVGSAAGNIAGMSDAVSGLADTLGGAIPGIPAGAIQGFTDIAGGIGQVAGLLGSFGVGGTTSGGNAYVPTKSEFSITLMPMYSRTSMRKFSLDRFVTGSYLNNTFGYI